MGGLRFAVDALRETAVATSPLATVAVALISLLPITLSSANNDIFSCMEAGLQALETDAAKAHAVKVGSVARAVMQ